MQFMNAPAFKENAKEALADKDLKAALSGLAGSLLSNRTAAVNALPEFEAMRDRAREVKNHTLEHLDFYLEQFEKNCQKTGGHVHWCADAEAAQKAVLKICRQVGAKTVTKSKSMVTEEIHLNSFLQRHDIQPVETDLGEYIIQLSQEPPSHIVGPAIHKTKDQVADLFVEHHHQGNPAARLNEPKEMISEARQVLRQKYFDADIGITGANFLIAESGSSIIVTNEGNGDLTQILPKTHIVVASIEKVLPTFNDAAHIMRLLARSATGQEFAAYTTVSTGPKRAGDQDGPENFHVILLDNGRSAMLGTPLQDMLRCIRCGACMNHCPVYQSVGGHTYGAVYVGPMGSVLSPSLFGAETNRHLPNASTFCGRCEQVCPMRIPLPKMLRYWRNHSFENKHTPLRERGSILIWAALAKRIWLYRRLTGLAIWALSRFTGGRGALPKLPFAGAWTKGRDFPAPEGKTFMQAWKARGGKLV